MSHSTNFLLEAARVCGEIDADRIEALAEALVALRERHGRLFILGVGGSAANAAHAVNDFRKLCGIETYAPSDNVSELTARTNDEGWETVFSEWLKVSRLSDRDALLVFSVGGGNAEKGVSVNLIRALDLARERRAAIFGIVSRGGGHTGEVGDVVVLVPVVHPDRVTPHAEAFQAVVWHCLVSHPRLQIQATKW
jgi:D-sedoheptulose 7-phosphate isomerase